MGREGRAAGWGWGEEEVLLTLTKLSSSGLEEKRGFSARI